MSTKGDSVKKRIVAVSDGLCPIDMGRLNHLKTIFCHSIEGLLNVG